MAPVYDGSPFAGPSSRGCTESGTTERAEVLGPLGPTDSDSRQLGAQRSRPRRPIVGAAGRRTALRVGYLVMSRSPVRFRPRARSLCRRGPVVQDRANRRWWCGAQRVFSDDAASHGGRGAGTLVRVRPEQEILTAAQLDAMTPDERRDEFERRVVRDAAQLSDELRERIRSTAERLARARADR